MWQTKFALSEPKNLGLYLIFGRAVNAISSLGVCSLWLHFISKLALQVPLGCIIWFNSTLKSVTTFFNPLLQKKCEEKSKRWARISGLVDLKCLFPTFFVLQ